MTNPLSCPKTALDMSWLRERGQSAQDNLNRLYAQFKEALPGLTRPEYGQSGLFSRTRRLSAVVLTVAGDNFSVELQGDTLIFKASQVHKVDVPRKLDASVSGVSVQGVASVGASVFSFFGAKEFARDINAMKDSANKLLVDTVDVKRLDVVTPEQWFEAVRTAISFDADDARRLNEVLSS